MIAAGLTDALSDRSRAKADPEQFGLEDPRDRPGAHEGRRRGARRRRAPSSSRRPPRRRAPRRPSRASSTRRSRPGTGEQPKATDTVKVNYRGTLTDGTEFDSSYKRNQPATFPLSGVIKCWTEGVQLMKVGGKSKLACPSDIAYGDRGSPPLIKPGSTLVFEVELLVDRKEVSVHAPRRDARAARSTATVDRDGDPARAGGRARRARLGAEAAGALPGRHVRPGPAGGGARPRRTAIDLRTLGRRSSAVRSRSTSPSGAACLGVAARRSRARARVARRARLHAARRRRTAAHAVGVPRARRSCSSPGPPGEAAATTCPCGRRSTTELADRTFTVLTRRARPERGRCAAVGRGGRRDASDRSSTASTSSRTSTASSTSRRASGSTSAGASCARTTPSSATTRSRDMTGVASGPHLDALRAWVTTGALPFGSDDARARTSGAADGGRAARARRVHARVVPPSPGPDRGRRAALRARRRARAARLDDPARLDADPRARSDGRGADAALERVGRGRAARTTRR